MQSQLDRTERKRRQGEGQLGGRGFPIVVTCGGAVTALSQLTASPDRSGDRRVEKPSENRYEIPTAETYGLHQVGVGVSVGVMQEW